MNKFRVTIIEENGDLNIYTEATAIDIDKNEIKVDYEDKQAIHQVGCTDEVKIKINR